jgi:nitrogen fixation protein NifU and related proteins
MYSATVKNRVLNAPNAGPMDAATHRGVAGTPGEGPYVILWFRVENGRIQEGAFNCNGCPTTIACASVAAELCVGRTNAEALALTDASVVSELGGLPEGKEHCAGQALQAVHDAFAREGEPHGTE